MVFISINISVTMKQKYIIYLVAALSLINLFACDRAKREQKIKTLTIGVMSSMDYLPIAVAQAANYFEEEDIVVKIEKFYSANDRDAALQSNNLDGAIIDYTGAAIQRQGGIDLYFASQCDGTFELIARSGIDIDEHENFVGKNFAVSRNTVVDFCTDMLLNEKNIKPSEIEKSEINKIPLRLEMLRNAKVDMTVLPDPFATMAQADGSQYVNSLENIDYFITGIVFMGKTIEIKENTIRSFYRAYNKAVSDLANKPVEEFNQILQSEIGFPEDLLDQIKLPKYQSARKPRGKDLQAASDWLKSKGLVKDDFDIFEMAQTPALWNGN